MSSFDNSQSFKINSDPHKGVKGQNMSYFQNFQNATAPTD